MSNELLRLVRERLPSPNRPGKPISRSELADMVNDLLFGPHRAAHSGFNANYVGKLERGEIRWPGEEYRAALRSVLGVDSDEELGFYDPRVRDADDMEVVHRRLLLSGMESAIGAGVVAAPMMELLTSTRNEDLPRRVDREHIANVIEVAVIFEHWDNLRGGAVVHCLADAELRRLARLLSLDCPSELRSDLHAAMARLAGRVGFMLFDAYEHKAARRRFAFALQCSEIGGDWHQRAMLLSSMARQAIWCGRPDDGLTLVEMGLVRADRLTDTEQAMLHTVRARALAKLGLARVQEALAAVGAADEAFSHSNPEEDPPWMRFYDAAQHHGDTAHALYDIVLHTGLKTQAKSRFAYSVQHHDPEYARSRAMSRTKLAALTMLQGDPREAAVIGEQALNDAGPVRSRRAVEDLRTLHRLAEPHAGIAPVSTLRARIEATVRAAL
ncbi:MAG TPA: hypothetical protein VFX61_20765 [Micromonosporaceae bacterium]|nr:hypothetical protein [Micromonosporaceae bacterium]